MFVGTGKFTRYKRILASSVLALGGLHCNIVCGYGTMSLTENIIDKKNQHPLCMYVQQQTSIGLHLLSRLRFFGDDDDDDGAFGVQH
jgi:hypothetical protein